MPNLFFPHNMENFLKSNNVIMQLTSRDEVALIGRHKNRQHSLMPINKHLYNDFEGGIAKANGLELANHLRIR